MLLKIQQHIPRKVLAKNQRKMLQKNTLPVSQLYQDFLKHIKLAKFEECLR